MIINSPLRRFFRLNLIIAVALISITVTSGCSGGGSQKPDFDATRAFDLLLAQTDLGPRNPGSPGWHQFQILIKSFLDSLECDYESQPLDYYDYLKGDTLQLVNWIVHLNPESSDRILLAAHYDCRPRAEYDPDPARREEPILGANDGASATAVLMHLAELFQAYPPPVGVDIVLFDGEDYGPPGRNNQYLIGSTYFASNYPLNYRYGLLLDMIGDRDLQIYRESLSDRYAKDINDKVWSTAARLNIPQFIDTVKHDVLDDHIPLIAAGVRMVDIIDFEYPHWHTHADTPDKCDSASLSVVGRVVIEVIYGE
jgi:hypothetical protein